MYRLLTLWFIATRMPSMHKVNCQSLSLVAVVVICLCYQFSTTHSQSAQYRITLNRGIGTNINQCTLKCSDITILDDSEERNYLFWINSTSNELRVVLASIVPVTNGIAFTINRRMEGEFFCGPDRNTLSNRISLVGTSAYNIV